MTISDDDSNPKSPKNLSSSMDAIAALRKAMEERLSEMRAKATAAQESSKPKAEQPAPQQNATLPPSLSAPEPTHPPVAATAPSAPVPTAQRIPGANIPTAFVAPTSAVPVSTESPKPFSSSGKDSASAKPAAEKPASDKSGKKSAGKKPETEIPLYMYNPAEWSRILFRIADRSQRLVQGFLDRNKTMTLTKTLPSFDPAHFSEAFFGLTSRLLSSPEQFLNASISLWQGYAQIWQTAFARMQGQNAPDAFAPAPTDKRFQDQEWQRNWLFDFVKQIYLLTAQQVQGLVKQEAEKLDPKMAKKLDFYTRQMVDAVSPSNFWMTNPEVLRTIFESGGESVIKGLENLLEDLERGHGELRISMTDYDAFTVGNNLATTSGKVVFQNELFQLIQYAPLTPTVYKTPYLVMPPWINKYYILDLREKNSFIRYLVSQGHTVFCMSWVNADERHANTNFDDYIASGSLVAMREIRRITGENTINMLGYCIGGTMLASTLAYLKAAPNPPTDLPKVATATYLVALTDFTDPGDIGVFIDEDQVRAIEASMSKKGYLDAASLATTFNMLRANDLIWSFVVNNYLLGKEPMPFDILYWNSDSTNLPCKMQSFYLREMYMANKLIQPNGLMMKGVPIDLRLIDTPTFMLSTREDHIAPWKSTYAATQVYKGPIKFVLAASGHIAGVVNHPSANKYSYWTNDNLPASPDAWFEGATQHNGSWWPVWIEWLKTYSGDQVQARQPQNGIEDAPGSYVKVRVV